MTDKEIRQLIVDTVKEGKDYLEIPKGTKISDNPRFSRQEGKHYLYGMLVKYT